MNEYPIWLYMEVEPCWFVHQPIRAFDILREAGDDHEEPTIGTPEEAQAVALSLTDEDMERIEREMEGGTTS